MNHRAYFEKKLKDSLFLTFNFNGRLKWKGRVWVTSDDWVWRHTLECRQSETVSVLSHLLCPGLRCWLCLHSLARTRSFCPRLVTTWHLLFLVGVPLPASNARLHFHCSLPRTTHSFFYKLRKNNVKWKNLIKFSLFWESASSFLVWMIPSFL